MYRRNRRFAPVLALSAVLALGMAACGGGDDEEAETTTTVVQGSDTVTIDMSDFAYTVSGPLTAGGALRITNTGQEYHVLAMGKFKPGVTLDQLRTGLEQAMQQEGGGGGGGEGATTTTGGGRSGATTTARGSGTDGDIRQQAGGTTTTGRGGATTTTGRGGTTTTAAGGGGEEEPDPLAQFVDEVGFPGAFMGPGQSVQVTAPNLTPGNYALICFVPTAGEGVPHFAKGMINELLVVEGPPPPEPSADATYMLAPGQAIQGPATLTPGTHTLKFEAAPGSQQLEPGIAKLNQGTTIREYFDEVTQLFEGEQPPPVGYAERLGGQLPWAGFDLEGVTSFYLTTDLTPGTYTMFAFDTEDEASLRAAREVLNIRVADGGTTTTTTR